MIAHVDQSLPGDTRHARANERTCQTEIIGRTIPIRTSLIDVTDMTDAVDAFKKRSILSQHCLFGNFNKWVRDNQYLDQAAARAKARHGAGGSDALPRASYKKRNKTKVCMLKVTAKTKTAVSPSKKKSGDNIVNHTNQIRHYIKKAFGAP